MENGRGRESMDEKENRPATLRNMSAHLLSVPLDTCPSCIKRSQCFTATREVKGSNLLVSMLHSFQKLY